MNSDLEKRVIQLEETCCCLITTLKIMTNCFAANNADFDYVSSYIDDVEEALNG